MVALSAGHAYASLADARSSFGDNGGGGDGAPQRLISAWSSLQVRYENAARVRLTNHIVQGMTSGVG